MDFRYAIRQLRKNPGFASTAVFTLALAIGINVAIFGFVDAALIKPLPYRDQSWLVSVFETNTTGSQYPFRILSISIGRTSTRFSARWTHSPSTAVLR